MKNFTLLFTLIFSFSCSSYELEKDGYDKDDSSYGFLNIFGQISESTNIANLGCQYFRNLNVR